MKLKVGHRWIYFSIWKRWNETLPMKIISKLNGYDDVIYEYDLSCPYGSCNL